MLEQTAGISEFNSKKFIKIGQEINSGQFFEKMCVYMKYIVNILSGNRYMARNWHGLRDQIHICTRLRRDVSQLSINASFFKFPLTEADVKFGLVKFC